MIDQLGMKLSFVNDYSPKYATYLPTLKRLTNKTFKRLKIRDNYIVELNFVDNKTIQKMNREYRHIDKPTDVLSFAFLERKKGEVAIKSKEPQILGEIIISLDKIKSQAQEFNHSFSYELAYLYLHGLLHLLGYDHVHNEREAKKMFQLADTILTGEKL